MRDLSSLFPRSDERGSIEAGSLRASLQGVSTCFHVRMNVALLKLVVNNHSSRSIHKFPRSDERGSIEATRPFPTATHSPRFPRSDERGSIEARLRTVASA